MENRNSLKSIIHSFKYDDGREVVRKSDKVSKRKKLSPEKDQPKKYKDLAPSLDDNLKVLFIGYNPGIQSSIQQHHYAHFTNLFWKLVNESNLLLKVLQTLNISIKDAVEQDPLLKEITQCNGNGEYKTLVKPIHDFEIIKYKIGFTDLVLRCTKTAQELTISEKMENVPRLIGEFNKTRSEFIVFIGKGIWEIIVKYISGMMKIKPKLIKEIFQWGKQEPGKDVVYDMVLKKLHELLTFPCNIYVFPNTSGLVTSLKYHEKLQLWNDLGQDILHH